MSVVPYRNYRDSGVTWLSAVPSHWELLRLGHYFNEQRAKVSDRDYAPLSVTKRGILPQLDTAAKTDDGDNRKRVSVGDFVINSRSDRKGSGGVSRFNGSVSLINTVLTPTRPLNMRFVDYLLTSIPFQEEFYRFGKGIVADLWSTNFSEMRNIVLALPDKAEQSAIADFLDRETGKIDALVAEQERLIALLKEKRQTVISQAVTKGLNPDAPMKPSGVEWIGPVPTSWGLRRLSALFNQISSGTTPPTDNPSLYGGDINWVTTGELRETFISDTEKKVSAEALDQFPALKVYPEGTLLIALYGATIGRLGILRVPASTNQACCAMSSPMGADVRFVFYVLLAAREHLLLIASGGGQPNINQEKLRSLIIPTPSVAEQTVITAFLDR